jgi:hypothetical protein
VVSKPTKVLDDKPKRKRIVGKKEMPTTAKLLDNKQNITKADEKKKISKNSKNSEEKNNKLDHMLQHVKKILPIDLLNIKEDQWKNWVLELKGACGNQRISFSYLSSLFLDLSKIKDLDFSLKDFLQKLSSVSESMTGSRKITSSKDKNLNNVENVEILKNPQDDTSENLKLLLAASSEAYNNDFHLGKRNSIIQETDQNKSKNRKTDSLDDKEEKIISYMKSYASPKFDDDISEMLEVVTSDIFFDALQKRIFDFVDSPRIVTILQDIYFHNGFSIEHKKKAVEVKNFYLDEVRKHQKK